MFPFDYFKKKHEKKERERLERLAQQKRGLDALQAKNLADNARFQKLGQLAGLQSNARACRWPREAE